MKHVLDFLILATTIISPSRSYHIRSSSNDTLRLQSIKDNNNYDEKCLCFKRKPTLILVPDKINTKGHGLKRVIVYLYKDEVANKVRMYTPGIEKQRQIPDLPFEDTDSLITVTTEEIADVLDNNPDAITIMFKEEHRPNKQDNDHYPNVSPETSRNKTLEPKADGGKIETVAKEELLQDNKQTPHLEDKSKNNQTKDIPGYHTFSKWFNDQVTHLKEEGSLKHVTVYSLKKLVEKNLKENGMVVSSDGVLTDLKGNTLLTDNLELRPIFIGDSVRYEKLVKYSEESDKVKLPADLPYLKSVLVTLVNPYKVLGVIPLGKVQLPNDYEITYKQQSNKLKTAGTVIGDTPEDFARLFSEVIEQLLLIIENKKMYPESYLGDSRRRGGRRALLDISAQMTSNIFGLFKSLLGFVLPTQTEVKSDVQTTPTPQPQPATNDSKNCYDSHREFKVYIENDKLSDDDIDDFVLSNTPIYYPKEFDNFRRSLKLNTNNNYEKSKELSDQNKETDVKEFDVDSKEILKNIPIDRDSSEDLGPGFRIIGGSPATSSGSPLSSRGRRSEYKGEPDGLRTVRH